MVNWRQFALGVIIFFSVLINSAQAIVYTANAYSGIVVNDIYGQPYHLPKTEGKWVVINYWASWCSACISEIPDLNRFAEMTKKSSVVFFAINYDELADNQQQDFARKYGVNYLMLHENPLRNLVPADSITTLPMTYVISPQGETQQLFGTQTAETIMRILR
jgi:thiol-disulfide isomerase/thioredoxin